MSNTTSRTLALVPNWLGDVAMCTPALRVLHRRFGPLTVAGPPAACELLEGLPWFERFVPFSAQPGVLRMFEVARRLRPLARELAVVFPHSFRAALLARLAGSRRRIGYNRDGRRWLLTDAVPPHLESGKIAPVYMVDEYLALVRPLGCYSDGQGLELHADPGAVEAVRARLGRGGPKIGIAPGAAFGASKRWPAGRFAQVADVLAEKLGAQCILLTGPGEESLAADVRSAAKTRLEFDAASSYASSIAMLKATISQLDLLICNDSGPRHVAVAFHVPTVCILGPTSPAYSQGPFERGRVLRVDVDCGPCQKPDCDTDHRCMTGIGVGDVVDAAIEVLGKW
jgi:heptosyltransferase-2